jgi:BolA protein
VVTPNEAEIVGMGLIAETIKQKLEAAFAPSRLDIQDESHLHAGHHGHTGRDETHFSVEMESPAFAGKGRVERQRMVYAVLAEELAGQVHALRLAIR